MTPYKLQQIQAKLKAPKGQFNNFGKYAYRSCEDIVEAAKPVLAEFGYALNMSDEIVMVGNRYYVKATVQVGDATEKHQAVAWAREEEVKKGMDGAQITGAASSYARKYALNGLFAIDDARDPDATNKHDQEESERGAEARQEEREKVASTKGRQEPIHVNGDWRDYYCTFGKKDGPLKGKQLGELTNDNLRYLYERFVESPAAPVDAKDAQMVRGLKMWHEHREINQESE